MRCALFFLLAISSLQAAPPRTSLPAADSPLSKGLVGLWRFDKSDGKTVKDASPNGNDGTIEFGEVRPEKEGFSLELDGLDAGVLIHEKSQLKFSQAITATLWVKAAELRPHTVLFGVPHDNPSWTTPMYGMYLDQQHVVYGMWLNRGAGKTLVESPSELPLNTWTFLAGAYDGASARLFVNGVLAAETPAHGPIAYNGQPLIIGKAQGLKKPPLKGRVGELRLYDRALSTAEIRGLFDQTKAAFDLRGPERRTFHDGTVIVETHGNSPEGVTLWRRQPTRLLERLDGYKPAAEAVKLDRYGGRLDQLHEPASGFFQVKKIDGRHWLIDPEGHRFFHVAMNTVREPRKVDANFGSAEKWAETVTAQLRANSFNGLGNGQSPRLTKVHRPLVWVLRKDFMFAFAREKKLTAPAAGTQGFVDHCMPVFHPEFEPFCERFGRDLVETAQDPCLLGIMTDNEVQCPVDLLDRYLALDLSNPDLKPGRDAAAAWLAVRKGAAGGSSIRQRDRYEFIAYAFQRYYQIVTKAIRKYDRNHLYLGSRINYHLGEFDNPWFWNALAPYHDVVSVNYYGAWGPQADQFAQWETWSSKPILLTEWYAKAADVPGLANTKGAGWLVHTQEDRARFYQHFALNALEIPSIVGFHWFKYTDDPAESKALDNAGGANKGMFDQFGQPYQPLLDRACAVNREVYPLIDFFDARNR